MLSDVVDISLFTGTIRVLETFENRARTQEKGKVSQSLAIKCGVHLIKLAKNGGLSQLSAPIRGRYYVAANGLHRKPVKEAELRKILSEIGANLQKLGNVKPEDRLRAKMFCMHFINN